MTKGLPIEDTVCISDSEPSEGDGIEPDGTTESDSDGDHDGGCSSRSCVGDGSSGGGSASNPIVCSP